MKVTYSWLKDFVEIKLSPQALAEQLTMAGLEVVSLEERSGDFIFEIEVTSNRPDWLSVIGVAREVAALTDKKLKLPQLVRGPQTTVHSGKKKGKNLGLSAGACWPLSIEIEDKKDCPLYAAKIIQGVKVGPSPDWLKKRLELIGCRSINNIVDITNYVLFETGEPLHAFDLDKIVRRLADLPVSQLNIIIRRAKSGEKITTIDGTERKLNEGTLIIASGAEEATGQPANRPTGQPIAIAGIMGGKDSEVTMSTKNVLLEAAVFNPVLIRRGRQAVGLQTDSSYRFERGVDLETAGYASWQAANLIQDLAKGSLVAAKSAGSAKTKSKTISLSVPAVDKILNIDIAAPKIKDILSRLGFMVKVKSKNHFSVTAPGYRPDVNLEADLIEEIARIRGYDQAPHSLPSVKPSLCAGGQRELVSLVKNILAGLGLNEVITYSLIDKDILNGLGVAQEREAIEILNPLSREQEILRPTLLPSLARCVAYNLNQKQDYVNIFEVARVFLSEQDQPREELVLGIALSGSKSLLLEQGPVIDTVSFLHLKGILEALFEKMGVGCYSFNPSQKSPGFSPRSSTHSHGSLSVMDICADKEKIGFMMKLEKGALGKFDIKNKDVFLLEISLERLFSYVHLQKKFTPPPKYPGITRDISFILKEDISVREILDALKHPAGPLLRGIKIVDYYKGKQIPAGYRGLTISCLYRADEKTLTEAEINPLHVRLCNVLTEQFAAKMR